MWYELSDEELLLRYYLPQFLDEKSEHFITGCSYMLSNSRTKLTVKVMIELFNLAEWATAVPKEIFVTLSTMTLKYLIKHAPFNIPSAKLAACAERYRELSSAVLDYRSKELNDSDLKVVKRCLLYKDI